MSESEDLNLKVTKMQRDIKEIKDALRDNYYEDISKYKRRLDNALSKRKEAPILYLEIDGFRCTSEIESNLTSIGKEIPHTNAWRAFNDMKREGIIFKKGVKGRSPIYDKKLWAKELDLDNYVRNKYDV
jgi:hypothetical protein